MRVPVAWGWLTLTLLLATSVAGDLLIDATTGCLVIDVPPNSPIAYTSEIFNQLATNVSNGATTDAFAVSNCIVCLNADTHITDFPAPTVGVPLDKLPAVRSENCIVSQTTVAGTDNTCSAAVCGNGRMEGTEACDDGDTTVSGSCNADCTALSVESSENRPIVTFKTIVDDNAYIDSDNEIIDRAVSLHSSDCVPLDGENFFDSAGSMSGCPSWCDDNGESGCTKHAKHGVKLPSFTVEQMGVTDGKTIASSVSKAAVINLHRLNDVDEEWEITLKSARPLNAVYTNSYSKTIVPSTMTSIFVECSYNDFNGAQLISTAQLIGINGNSVPSDCSTTGAHATSQSTTNTYCKWAGGINAGMNIQSICGAQKSKSREARVYILSQDGGNLYADLTLKLDRDGTTKWNSYKYAVMFNFQTIISQSILHDPEITWVSGTDKMESDDDQTLVLNWELKSDFTSANYDLTDAQVVWIVEVTAANTGSGASDWSQVVLMDNIEVGSDGSKLGTRNNLDNNRAYFNHITIDGKHTGNISVIVPKYVSSVLYSDRTTFTIKFVTIACSQYDQNSPASHIFEKEKTSAGLLIQAKIFDTDKINDGFSMIQSPVTSPEGADFDFTVKWDNLATTDQSESHYLKSLVFCFTGLDPGKDYPTFAAKSASTVVDDCTNNCCTLSSSHTSWDDVRAQTAGDGWVVTVTPCTYSVDDITLTVKGTVEEQAIYGFTEAQAVSTADNFRSSAAATAIIAAVDTVEVVDSFTSDVTLTAGAEDAVDFRVCTAVDTAVTSSNCSFEEHVSSSGVSFEILGLDNSAVSKKALATSYLTQSVDGATPSDMTLAAGMTTAPTVPLNTLSQCHVFSLKAKANAATCDSTYFQVKRLHTTEERTAIKSTDITVNVDILELAKPITINDENSGLPIVLDEDETITLKNFVSFQRDTTGCTCEHMTQLKVSFSADDMSIVENNIIFGATTVGNTGEITINDFTNILNNAPELFSSDKWTFTDAFEISFASNFNTIGQPTITMVIEITATGCDGGSTVTSTQTRTIAINDIVDMCTMTSQIQQSRYKLGQWTDTPLTLSVSTIDEIRNARVTVQSMPAIQLRAKLGQPILNDAAVTSPEDGSSHTLACSASGKVSDYTALSIADQQANWELQGDGTYKCSTLVTLEARATAAHSWVGENGQSVIVSGFAATCPEEVITNYYGYCTSFTGGDSIGNWESTENNYFGSMVISFTSSISDSSSGTKNCDNVAVGGSTSVVYNLGERVDVYGEIVSTTSLDLTVENGVSVANIDVDATTMNDPSGGFQITMKRQPQQEYNLMQNSLATEVKIENTCQTTAGDTVSMSLNTAWGNGVTDEAEWTNQKQEYIGAGLMAATGFAWSSSTEDGERVITVKIDDSTHKIESPCEIKIILTEVTVQSQFNVAPVFAPFYTTQEFLKLNINAQNGVIGVVSTQATATQDKDFSVCFDRTGGKQGNIDATFTINSYCDTQYVVGNHITIGGENSASTNATWSHLDDAVQCKNVVVDAAASDCNIEVLIDNTVAITIWLSGKMGSSQVSPKQPSHASKAHIMGANANVAGQTFVFTRVQADYTAGDAKFVLSASGGATITPSTMEWTVNSDTGDDEEREFVLYAPGLTDGNIQIDVQLQVKDLQANYQNQGSVTTTIFAVVDDITTGAWCSWGSNGVVGDGTLEAATFFSSVISQSVSYQEGASTALIIAEGVTDTQTFNVTRSSAITSLSFKLKIAYAQEAFAPVSSRIIAEDFINDLSTVYTFSPGEYSVSVVVQMRDDSVPHVTRHGQFYAEYVSDHYGADVTPSTATALDAGCTAHMADGTIFSNAEVTALEQMDFVSTRRLLSTHQKQGTHAFGVFHDNDAAPVFNMPASDATTARFWSTASLDTWDNNLNVEMTFQVPVYTETVESDRYYGSFAMLGSCPTYTSIDASSGKEDWSNLFTDLTELNADNTPQICSTFVPLTDTTDTTDALLYARKLAGLVGSSSTTCNNTAWPCADRWQMPTVPGFDTQTDMVGHKLQNVGDMFLPVYPYKYSGTLTQLQKCNTKSTGSWTGIVTTTSDLDANGNDVTSYGFETCIVTYGPRFAYSNNTDLIVHTATQKVSLSSSNEAVVTAIMFDMADDIRVSIVPNQESCAGPTGSHTQLCDQQSGDTYALQNPCSVAGSTTDLVHLELATTIDVPVAPDNNKPYTGVWKIPTEITAGGNGCHLSTNPMEWNSVYTTPSPVITSIDRYEKRAGSTEYVKYTYIRSAFTMNTPCISATTSAGVVVENAFMECAAAGKDGSDYDFNVQFISCDSIDNLRVCATGVVPNGGKTCAELITDGNCVKSGDHASPTLIRADITFAEWPPNSELAKSTSIALTTNTFKYGSKVPVDFKSSQAVFNTKDTIVVAVAPQDGSSFSEDNFGLVCPKSYMSAYNPVSDDCTTSQATMWTYGMPAYPQCSAALVAQTDSFCQTSYPNPQGSPYNTLELTEAQDCSLPFPAALYGVSVMFTGVQRVRICTSPTTAKMVSHMVDGSLTSFPYYEVKRTDQTWHYWEHFYQYDYRATQNKVGDSDPYNCELVGSCQQACYDATGSPQEKQRQTDQGCGSCNSAQNPDGTIKHGHILSPWILPFVAHQKVVENGIVQPGFIGGGLTGSDITSGQSDVKICKHQGALQSGFGSTVGYNIGHKDGSGVAGKSEAPGICTPNTAASGNPSDSVAHTPRYCGFPELPEATGFKAGPTCTGGCNNKYITAGMSISAAGLKPNKLYSVALYCYITNCKVGDEPAPVGRRLLGMTNESRRLLSAGEHDVVVDENNEYDTPLTAAAGVHLLQVRGELSVTPAPTTDTSAPTGWIIAVSILGGLFLIFVGFTAYKSWLNNSWAKTSIKGGGASASSFNVDPYKQPLLPKDSLVYDDKLSDTNTFVF